MRLIDYDAAIDRYYAEYEKQDICDGLEDRDFIKRCFDEAPTVDAAPVVHGRWIDKGWDGDFSWRIDGHGHCWRVISCSVCGGNLCGGAKQLIVHIAAQRWTCQKRRAKHESRNSVSR